MDLCIYNLTQFLFKPLKSTLKVDQHNILTNNLELLNK